MKKHLSVLALYLRSTAWRVLLLLFVMAAAETALLWSNRCSYEDYSFLESHLSCSGMEWVCFGFFAVLLTLLCLSGTSYGSQADYTLQRLSIKPQTAFLWQSIVCCIWITAFWALQVVFLVVCSSHSLRQIPAGDKGPQTMLMCLYQWDFSANLLPLGCVAKWLRNVLLVLASGVSAAHFSWQQRKGHFDFTMILSALVCVFTFMNAQNRAVTLIGFIGAIAILFYVVIHIFKGEEDDVLETIRQDTTAASS